MKKLLLIFMFIPVIVLSSDKKEKKRQPEIEQLKKLLTYIESEEYQILKQDLAITNKQLLALGKPLLQYQKMNLNKPLIVMVQGKALQLINIETDIGYDVAKHYSFVTGSRQFRESDGSPWERKEFMVVNIEKSGLVKPPQFSFVETYICVENGYS